MLRIGLIGCGTHANWAVSPAIRNSGRWNLAAVCDINADNLAKIKAPDALRFSDYKAMIREAKLDAVYIATLSNTHAAIAIDAFAAGLNVVVEKPMADTIAECEQMLAAAEKAKRVLAVNFENRYHECHRRIRTTIRSGVLGKVESVHLQQLWDGHKSFGELAARRKRLMDLAGGLDCGIHKLDMVRYYVGGNWEKAHAMGRWFGEDIVQAPHVSILASLDNGVMVSVNASLGYTSQIKPKHMNEVITIVGNKGVISLMGDDHGKVKIISESVQEEFDHETPGHAEVMVEFMQDVADVVEGKRAVADVTFASGRDGLAAQWLTVEANRQAMETRPKGA